MKFFGSTKNAEWSLRFLRIIAVLAILAFSVLLISLIEVMTVQNALWTGLAEASGASSLLLIVLGFGAALRYRLQKSPGLARPALFVSLLTVLVFSAHVYIVDSPPAVQEHILSGAVGGDFHDCNLLVSSSLVGKSLSLSVSSPHSVCPGDPTPAPIVGLQFSVANATLADSGILHPPTWVNPLVRIGSGASNVQGASYVQGSWQLTTLPSGNLTVRYDSVPLVMDEGYYVFWATGMLSHVQCVLGGNNCHLEHPPLVVSLIAASMFAFGIGSAAAWRLPSVLMGTLSVPLLFVLILHLSGNRRWAYFSAALLALENLYFVHSSIAVLDVPAIFFGLLGLNFYFWKARLWKLDNYIVAGVLFGLAGLSKETAVLSFGGLATFVLLFSKEDFRVRLTKVARLMVPAGLTFIIGLQLFDSAFVSGSTFAAGAYPWFYLHLQYMLRYGTSLGGTGWANGALGGFITPPEWVLIYSPIKYLVTADGTLVTIAYLGTTSPLIVWMVFLWVPLVGYDAFRGWRRTAEGLSDEMRAGLFLLVLFLWTYVPYVLLWLYGRVTYPFYILPAIPFLSGGAAYFVTRDWFPRKMALFYLAGTLAMSFLYFPVKDFLPAAVRMLLSR